jgi:hypothetical protein
MKTLLALAAVVVVILLVWFLKRKSTPAKAPQPQAPLHTLQQKVLQERQPEASEIPFQEPVSVSVAAAENAPIENRPGEQSPVGAIHQVVRVETIPEDSMLRRHYFSNLEAERLAITHPYPTDSMLRRHYESGLAWQLKPACLVGSNELVVTAEEAESSVSADQSVSKRIIPEDSTLKRHFLTQIQAEVETNLSTRPTDATLRRHYDSLVKSRVEAYLTALAA